MRSKSQQRHSNVTIVWLNTIIARIEIYQYELVDLVIISIKI